MNYRIQSSSQIIVALFVFVSVGMANQSRSLAVDDRFDSSFGANGEVITSLTPGDDDAYSMQIQNDGKILLAGCASSGNGDFALARYNSDGTLDNSFGQSGFTTTPIGTRFDCASTMKLLSDGKILLGGYGNDAGVSLGFALARYTTNGTLDSSFGQSGVTTKTWSTGNQSISDILILPSGKVFAGGSRFWSCCGFDFMYAQFSENGILDTSYNKSAPGLGEERFITGTANDILVSLLTDANGRILAVGESAYRVAIVKYGGDNKTPDPTFGSSGKVVTDIGQNVEISDAKIQQDGKIVVIGIVSLTPGAKTLILRYNTDGSLDQSFGSNGRIELRLGNDASWATQGWALALQADGKILIGGSDNGRAMVARFSSSGEFDTSFGGTGVIAKSVGVSDSAIREIAVNSEGQIFAAGVTRFSTGADFLLWKIQPSSSLPTNQENTSTDPQTPNQVSPSTTTINIPFLSSQTVPISLFSPSTTSSISSRTQSSVVSKVGRLVTSSALIKTARLFAPSTSKISLRVETKSKSVCKVSGQKVKMLKKGNCRVSVVVAQKKGLRNSKIVTIKVL